MTGFQRNRVPSFTPTMLTTYQRCPRQYRSRYVDRDVVEDFSPALARGNAAHAVLRDCFALFQQRKQFPIDLRDRVEANLPRDQYTDPEEWKADVESVLESIRTPLRDFDGSANVLAVERMLEYEFSGSDSAPAFRLRAKVDLVLEHNNGVIEYVDWKTGSSTVIDPIQMVASRIVVESAFPRRGEVRSTVVFLSHGSSHTEVLSKERARPVWDDMKGIVTAILAEQDWQPRANALCEYCSLFGNRCTLYPPTANQDALDWLESEVT